MPRVHKRRDLNDAFIAFSDDDESKLSGESTNVSNTASSSARNLFRGKVKKGTKVDETKKTLKDNENSFTGFPDDYSTYNLRRNFNLQPSHERYPKDNSRPKPNEKLKRSGSLSAYDECRNNSKTRTFFNSNTRRSLDSNNSPLVDISNANTPEFLGTLRESKLENSSMKSTPKRVKHKPSNENELAAKTSKSNNKSRMSYPGCSKAKSNPQRHTQHNKARHSLLEYGANIRAPDQYQDFLHNFRNLSAWRDPNSTTKQKYYGGQKVNLVELEVINEAIWNNLSPVPTCITGSTNSSTPNVNLNIVESETSENELEFEANHSLESSRDGSPNHKINESPEVNTPGSPIATLMSKNLSELFVSKIINRLSPSQEEVVQCTVNEINCEDHDVVDENTNTNSSLSEQYPGNQSICKNESG